MLRPLSIFLLLLLPRFASAQVSFLSPLPFGILQVRGDHAELRLRVLLPNPSWNFQYKLSSDIDTSDPRSGWRYIQSQNAEIDTIFMLSKTLRNYSLLWSAGSGANDTSGIIAGLTPGHIIGIAGQSNAEGFSWDPVAEAIGDVRMLRIDSVWRHASEPTGTVAQGPWIVMANELYKKIGDTLPIGIVNTAVGGTGLTNNGEHGRWLRNSANPEDTSLYGKALKRFLNAGSHLECLCWIQGEADASTLPQANVYRVAFAKLMAGFWQDLADTFPIYHLQISGLSVPGHWVEAYPVVREAQRTLPPSTLAGTAVGRPLQGDRIHYTASTYNVVGRMFSGAVLQEQYGKQTSMYPPLVPDTTAYLDSITDGSIAGRYCFSLRWTRGGRPASLSNATPQQYFALHRDGVPLDTSHVWCRIAPNDPSRVLIGLQGEAIALDHDWRVTYDYASDAERAPLATIDPATNDTIFATAFFQLPVSLSAAAKEGVGQFHLQLLLPNPTASDVIHCYILSFRHQRVSVELHDDRGGLVWHEQLQVEDGQQEIPVSTKGLPSGSYWVTLRDEQGVSVIEKAIVIR